MANEEHLAILKRGVEAWNKWRNEYPDPRPDLSGVNLNGVDLSRVDFWGVNLSQANLIGARFEEAKLFLADFNCANLSHAHLGDTNATGAKFNYADLNFATLFRADLSSTELSNANLSRSDLIQANLTGADLTNTDFSHCGIAWTVFGDNDLSRAIGLDTVTHMGPSIIGVYTLYKSNGQIPEVFLRGTGMSDTFITHIPSLIGAEQAIQFYSCFISYSHKDEEFAKRLHSRMRDENLRVWFAPEDIKGGRKIQEQIEHAIQLHDRLLLVLSEGSMQSEWVMTEIRNARQAEIREKRRKLFSSASFLL